MWAWKSAWPLVLLGLGTSLVDAMPTAENLNALMDGSARIPKRCPFSDMQDQETHGGLEKRLLADSPKSPVDGMRANTPNDRRKLMTVVTGEHAFQPPNKGDQRGPCPGLNALANHNYIPHNGIVSVSSSKASFFFFLRHIDVKNHCSFST